MDFVQYFQDEKPKHTVYIFTTLRVENNTEVIGPQIEALDFEQAHEIAERMGILVQGVIGVKLLY